MVASGSVHLLAVEAEYSCHVLVFFYRPVGPNHRPPIPVNRTGLIGNQLKPDKFKFQIQTPVQMISTGKPTGLLG